MDDPISKMIEALKLEAAAIRKKGGITQVELQGGERVGQVRNDWLYRFLVADDLYLPDETPVRIIAGQEDVSGVIVSFRDGILLIALEQDLGPKIPTARLVADPSFLVEQLGKRLMEVQQGEIWFRRLAADRVIGQAPSRTADAEPDPRVIADGVLNADQLAAVRRSLGSDTTFVWGPPGTGKTATLARIVEAHYRAGRSVLLVSNTNLAVDAALERVAERLEDEPDFDRGLVIRQGTVVKEELRRRFGSRVILEEVVARLAEGLRREKDELVREAGMLEAEERLLAKALDDLERLARRRELLAAREQARTRTEAVLASQERELAHHRDLAAKLASDLERARMMGVIRRLLAGLNPERLERQRAEAERQAQAVAEAARATRAELDRLAAELATLRSEVEALAAKTARYPPQPEIQKSLSVVRARLDRIRGRIAAIDQELAELEQKILGRCRILATTAYRTYLGKGPRRQFDVVVVDEASMLMPPLVYYAAGLAGSSVTVAGDFRQLPPIVQSDGPLAEEWLKRDVFEKAKIPDCLAKGQSVPHLVALRTQYRMRKAICTVVSDLFYPDEPLQSDPAVEKSPRRSFPLGDAPLIYVDTAPLRPWAALRPGTHSRYNLLHALLIRSIVVHLAETGFLPPAGEPNAALGAVTPYASQARLIQALLDDRLDGRAAGIAATVHRFQGNEKEAMLVDLTDSFGARLGHFLGATGLREDGARLLNVALSRARHHVILIGNFDFLRAKAPRDGFVRRLIDHFEEHGDRLDPEMLLPLAERDWIDGLHRVLPVGFDLPEDAAGAFTEGTFYFAFAQDLARARESIVILSPLMTAPGTARWVDLLRGAIARGVHVRIVTRPPYGTGQDSKDEVAELIRELRSLGVTVDLRERMHEKMAIIDDRILWHGSLNIFSHRKTSESMLRIVNSKLCRHLDRFLSLPVDRREQNDGPSSRSSGNPRCPDCGGLTIWREGRFGIWFECEDPACGGKVNASGSRRPSRKRNTRKAAVDRGDS